MRSLPFALSALLIASAASAAPAGQPAAVNYEGNLSRIPATDPQVTDAPTLLPAVRGVHPRLLFTPAQVVELRKRVADSPLLKPVADKVIADSRRYRAPAANPLPVVTNDTAALSIANGQWPSLAYAYALEPNPDTLAGITSILTRMLEQPYWADTAELDANMGAGCNLYAVALLYDAAWNDLDPALRRQVAERLLVQARRMFHLGHKQLGLMPIKYWQQDPANNHRWYRLRGLAAALLSIADEPGLDTAYLLAELKKEADFIMKWFPDEGDCHEGSGYQRFGFRSVFEAMTMMDNALGTTYRRHAGFATAWKQQLYYWIPSGNSSVSFGDAQNAADRINYDDPVFFTGASISKDANAQAALLRRFQKTLGEQLAPWSLLAYYDPALSGGDYRAVPTNHLFTDMGAASFRDSWEADAVVFTFKCGPYGGYSLNAYRHANLNAQGLPHYVNIAHDDPDANTFALNIAGEHVFHPGLYATRKITRDHSSVTVGDQGQIQEGGDWTQPTPDRDMRELSFITGWKTDARGNAIVEGEAGPAYQGALDRFRRTAVWLPGAYILLLDDIRPVAATKDPITWRGTVADGRFIRPEQGYAKALAASGREVPFQILANRPVSAALDPWFLAGRWGHSLQRQFQFSTEAAPVRIATLVDPWKRDVTMTYEQTGDTVTLVVKTPAGSDTWTWTPAADNKTPSAISGLRGGQPLIALTAADTPPAPGH